MKIDKYLDLSLWILCLIFCGGFGALGYFDDSAVLYIAIIASAVVGYLGSVTDAKKKEHGVAGTLIFFSIIIGGIIKNKGFEPPLTLVVVKGALSVIALLVGILIDIATASEMKKTN